MMNSNTTSTASNMPRSNIKGQPQAGFTQSHDNGIMIADENGVQEPFKPKGTSYS